MSWLQKIAEEHNKICPECYALHDSRYVYTGFCVNCGASLKEDTKE